MARRRPSDERLALHYLFGIACCLLVGIVTIRLLRPETEVASESLINLVAVIVGFIAGNRKGG